MFISMYTFMYTINLNAHKNKINNKFQVSNCNKMLKIYLKANYQCFISVHLFVYFKIPIKYEMLLGNNINIKYHKKLIHSNLKNNRVLV